MRDIGVTADRRRDKKEHQVLDRSSWEGAKSVLLSDVFECPNFPLYLVIYFFTCVNIMKSTDFKSPNTYYYSNSVVEMRKNEKGLTIPLNL